MPASRSLVIILSVVLGSFAKAHADEPNSKAKILEMKTESEKVRKQTFCSKSSGEEAEKRCRSWLNEQKLQLGTRLLTSSCSSGEMTADSNCFYRSEGELSYILQKTDSVYDVR